MSDGVDLVRLLREPCDHGRYEEHPTVAQSGAGGTYITHVPLASPCPGGRTLTDAEALSLLLTDVCDCTVARMVDGVIPTGEQPADPDCPSCGGSGRIPRDRVEERINHNGEPTLVIPMSMLEGTTMDRSLRPWWCQDQTCVPDHASQDKRDGGSGFCVGRTAELMIVERQGIRHENDGHFCVRSPRGVVMLEICEVDLDVIARNALRGLTARGRKGFASSWYAGQASWDDGALDGGQE